MKSKQFAIMALVVCLMSILANNALAFYNPQTGRWLSRDPIEERGGVNLYAFANNDPIDLIDRLGLDINIITAPISSPLGADKCCEGGKLVNKVSVYIVNRGSPVNQQPASSGLPQWSGGHIDLVIPGGSGIGMVGFYGKANGQGSFTATFIGIPGTENIKISDWTRSGPEGGRINYLAPEGGLVVNTATGPVTVSGIRSYICEIKVCPSAAKKMRQRALEVHYNPGSFRMLGRNCSSMGCNILNAGGEGPNGIYGTDNPQSLQSQIGSKNCFYGYTGLGTDGHITVQRASDQSPPIAAGGSSH